MVALHGGVLLLGLFWLTKRHNNWGWLPPAGFMGELMRPRRIGSSAPGLAA